MSGWVAFALLLTVGAALVAWLCFRLARLHLELADSYRTISAMLQRPDRAEAVARREVGHRQVRDWLRQRRQRKLQRLKAEAAALAEEGEEPAMEKYWLPDIRRLERRLAKRT